MIDKNKQYKTRSGLPVRIYATDGGGAFPVHGAMFHEDMQTPVTWTSDGSFDVIGRDDSDLIEVKPKIKVAGWAAVYSRSVTSLLFDSKSEVMKLHPDATAYKYIEFEVEEGEGK